MARVFWGLGATVLVLLLLLMTYVALERHFHDFQGRDNGVIRQTGQRTIQMPPAKNIKLVLNHEEMRNPGERVNFALRECIGRPKALLGASGRAEFDSFVAGASEGDTFLLYCSSPESWEMLAGRAGYVRVREGKAVAELVLVMN